MYKKRKTGREDSGNKSTLPKKDIYTIYKNGQRRLREPCHSQVNPAKKGIYTIYKTEKENKNREDSGNQATAKSTLPKGYIQVIRRR